jgi:diadenosine tetraphosphate (Ap4A) HIT family hydrolase
VSPKTERLETLARAARAAFLDDMGLLGDAVAQVCSPRRINYSNYGNTDPYLHAHVVPSYEWEAPERLSRPIWTYPAELWTDPAHIYSDEKHGDLGHRIAAALEKIANP